MREIEFRGKSIMEGTEGRWLYSFGIKYGDDIELLYCDEETSDTWYYVDRETIGQYTGMKDINRTKIYEGDIVAEEGHYVNSDRLVYQKIQWKENYACWLRGEYQRLTPKNIERYKITVIGNIYDNPDLLKEEL